MLSIIVLALFTDRRILAAWQGGSKPARKIKAPASTFIHPGARRGRGALSNATNRFDSLKRITRDESFAFDDGWGGADEAPLPLRTTVTRDASRSVIAKNESPDLPFDQSINPYRGCEHGCVYCYARPSHAYLGFSPGLDFESRLLAKPDAPRLLARALARPSYRCQLLALGTNTDPYQPVERTWRITRGILEVLADHRHPVGVVTKSSMVTRDIDLLSAMAEKGLAQVCISLTTLDRKLARRMEPRAATPERRLETIRRLADAGIPTGVMVAPVIPALTDSELESILAAAAKAGALTASYVFLRLPHELKDLFREWLAMNEPLRAKRIMNHVRAAHGGKDYEPVFGKRGRGEGAYAEMIARRFRLGCQRFGLNRHRVHLDTGQFRRPSPDSDQMSLF